MPRSPGRQLRSRNMLSNKRKAQLIIVAAFVFGIVVGASGQYLFWRSSQSQTANTTDQVLNELTSAVKLSAEQRNQADRILQESQQQYQELRVQVRPQFNAVRDATRKRIAALLTSEQQTLFEKYTRELDAKREEKEKASANSKK